MIHIFKHHLNKRRKNECWCRKCTSYPQEDQENTHKEHNRWSRCNTQLQTKNNVEAKSAESRNDMYQVKAKKKTETVTKQRQCCTHTVAQNKHTPGPVTETQHRKILWSTHPGVDSYSVASFWLDTAILQLIWLINTVLFLK